MNARLSQCVLTVGLAVAALMTSAAQGATTLLNVDLNGGADFGGLGTGITYTGPAVLSLSATDQWNGISPQFPRGPGRSNVALTDSTGAATGVTLDALGFDYGITYASTAFSATPYNNLMYDFFGNDIHTAVTITFHHLPDNSSAEFVLYGQAQTSGASAGTATIGTDPTVYSWSNNGTQSSFSNGVNYLDIPVVVQGDGDLIIHLLQPGPSGEMDINGFQLLVPEPASMSLIVVGSLALLKRRR